MRNSFGHPSRFAITLGSFWGNGDAVRVVDVYAAGRRLTCDDNHAYVPHFAGELERSVRALLDGPQYRGVGRPFAELSPADNHRRLCADAVTDNGQYLDYRFMDWGPTADNVSMHYFREGDTAFLPFSFWRANHHDSSELGQVFVAELPWRELACVLHEAAWALMWAWADRSRWPQQAEPDAARAPAADL
ncbi:hypothetical protein R5W24_003513 [Gemmata sp. JC717]|uniref:hypothetical protein n=1 Tax=Gemmata algarum TaxID=2975278 RepID=UPI0021BA94F8|nr:hypothetical protein [Gemmata algarum]MDY3554391.1 hypothetical protein [Gemmata algarum]